MQNYRKSSHTIYDIKYHIVWVTKYRYPVLIGKISIRIRDIIKEICEANEVKILKGHVSSDHVHIFVSVPPHISVSKLVKSLKGKSSRKIQQEYKEIRKKYWGCHLWAIGYFCASSGNVTDEIIMEYINNQDLGGNQENFKISVL